MSSDGISWPGRIMHTIVDLGPYVIAHGRVYLSSQSIELTAMLSTHSAPCCLLCTWCDLNGSDCRVSEYTAHCVWYEQSIPPATVAMLSAEVVDRVRAMERHVLNVKVHTHITACISYASRLAVLVESFLVWYSHVHHFFVYSEYDALYDLLLPAVCLPACSPTVTAWSLYGSQRLRLRITGRALPSARPSEKYSWCMRQ
ncbi:hypothetical protein ASPBRDRAFT_38914 [Aspergillus brasiliensis CBS 101740]|uniref:Uncharacterized protein n=1 Tax=Aspergillus brasiliensis (strain CBS 101740 / IMI 381727 / IBT 21946) TaxID=767769 RepID=A0A1L9UXP6_ASPBC|nr:hypothetical protein ASPBRDRAFT_38914 [Aspergillus brasiliensis CBS 101740]